MASTRTIMRPGTVTFSRGALCPKAVRAGDAPQEGHVRPGAALEHQEDERRRGEEHALEDPQDSTPARRERHADVQPADLPEVLDSLGR